MNTWIGWAVARLGSRQEVLELGEQPTGVRHVPPQLVAEMIFRKIELLAVPPPKPVEEEEAPDPKKKKPPAKGKGKKEEEEEVGVRATCCAKVLATLGRSGTKNCATERLEVGHFGPKMVLSSMRPCGANTS